MRRRWQAYERHGAPAGRALGVSVAHLKTAAKKSKWQRELACELYDTGMIEAMYLAGMIADGKRMSRPQLQHWAEAAEMLSDLTAGQAATSLEEMQRPVHRHGHHHHHAQRVGRPSGAAN